MTENSGWKYPKKSKRKISKTCTKECRKYVFKGRIRGNNGTGNNMRKMTQKLENDRTKANENLTTFSSHLFFLMQTL